MQNVNIGLNWWLAHGNFAPEVVVVRVTPEGAGLCRRVVGPEVWVPLTDMTGEGEWCGPVTPPASLTTAALTVATPNEEVVQEVEEATEFPLADTESAPANAVEEVPSSPSYSYPPCPPEVEALLGKEKDTVVAAQYGLSVNTVAEWRKARGIPRFRTRPVSEGSEESVVTVEPTPVPVPVKKAKEVKPREATDESALSDLVARRFSEGVSDEDMAQEAGVAVAKVVNARLALGLHRPRGRKPGVPQGPRKAKAEVETTPVQEENTTSTATDAELDALLG